LERTFRIRGSEAIPAALAARLYTSMRESAPHISLNFVAEGDEWVDDLRDGRIDLDIGVTDDTGPEIKLQTLFRERMVGAVRTGHPLSKGKVDAKRFASFVHISASRRGRAHGPIDTMLAAMNLKRQVAIVVPGHMAAMLIAAGSDLVAVVGESFTQRVMALGLELTTFELPVKTKLLAVSQAWHPRLDADPAHRWLRQKVREAFAPLAER
jgi:DNA-binding transcriptional LysR family regulator